MDNRFESVEEATEYVTDVVFMQKLRERILELENSGNTVDSELLSVFYDLVRRIERQKKIGDLWEEIFVQLNRI